TLAVLSPDFLKSAYTQPEWAAAFAQDPTGRKSVLVPVRVRECELTGLLSQIVYINLVGLSEKAAIDALLLGIKNERITFQSSMLSRCVFRTGHYYFATFSQYYPTLN
ncbi:MAG: toll/interleukin-1 receptor domain-containing protein, partial [Deltaproteobacteria bacterium]|nr:toll/interleukin-1 receptor domain-containing protein [Deltaproteobacteria bacterium]